MPPRRFVITFWHLHRGIYRLTRGRAGLGPRARAGGAHRCSRPRASHRQPRSVIIGYFEDGHNLVSLAMNGWGAREPAWWLNLQAHPDAVVEFRGGRREVRGRPVMGEERERLWQRWRTIDKNLDGYAKLRPTETAVVVSNHECWKPRRPTGARPRNGSVLPLA